MSSESIRRPSMSKRHARTGGKLRGMVSTFIDGPGGRTGARQEHTYSDFCDAIVAIMVYSLSLPGLAMDTSEAGVYQMCIGEGG